MDIKKKLQDEIDTLSYELHNQLPMEIRRAAVELPEADSHYTEKLVLLPGSYQINDRSRSIAEAPPRAELGLAEDAFVFCSFNQTYKLNPGVLDAWARILDAVPHGVRGIR